MGRGRPARIVAKDVRRSLESGAMSILSAKGRRKISPGGNILSRALEACMPAPLKHRTPHFGPDRLASSDPDTIAKSSSGSWTYEDRDTYSGTLPFEPARRRGQSGGLQHKSLYRPASAHHDVTR